jgi:hypothetical protein
MQLDSGVESLAKAIVFVIILPIRLLQPVAIDLLPAPQNKYLPVSLNLS